MLLYYITDRSQFPGDGHAQRQLLLKKIAEAARAGVDFIQLREKDLTSRELASLARAAMQILHENSPPDDVTQAGPRLLINSRVDVALAVGADGVHLPSGDLSPSQVHAIWKKSRASQNRPTRPIVTISCHSAADVAEAAAGGADFALFAPVFEKRGAEQTPAGLDALHAACRHGIPVIALGGITLQNADACMKAGAAGIAAIRLFQQNNTLQVAETLRQGKHF